MLISESINSAWLLSRYGDEIPVIEHPYECVEIDRIAEIIYQYGTDTEKQTARTYRHTQNPNIGKELIKIYHQNWCQVREWNDCMSLNFRISSSYFNWYRIIVDFLINHPHPNYKITVSHKGDTKIYWNEVSYDYAIAPENEMILENLLE